jgi:hypothetical protein
MVPVVWIEQTTYRLQGGCSATELNGHIFRVRSAKKPRCNSDYRPTT